MDNGKVTVITLLDMSATFDTIDHSILLERHLAFLVQFFNGSKLQIIHFKQTATRSHRWLTFMPARSSFWRLQGSVIGPFLFCLYTTSISQIITTHDVSDHMYADDTQVYIELSQSDTHKSISSLSDCLTDISLWMKSSKLRLS